MSALNTHQKWRTPTKAVCILETIRVIFETLCYAPLIAIAAVNGPLALNKYLFNNPSTDAGLQEDENVTRNNEPFHRLLTDGTKVLTWLSLIMTMTFWVIEMCVVERLRAACEPNCDALTARFNASIWMYANIIMFCCSLKGHVSLLAAGPLGYKVLVGGKFVLSVVGIFIVQMFTHEQETILAKTNEDAVDAVNAVTSV